MRIPWPGLGAFALVAGVSFDRGGYFPGPWGWTILGAAWAVGLALLGRSRPELSRPAIATAVLLAAFTAWTGLSAAWSLSVTQTALETQRVAVYASAFLAAALWARSSAASLLTGVWAAIVLVCGWALLTRLVPDRYGVIYFGSGNRLSVPVGYWNSLGLFAAMGALLALALACESSSRVARALAAGSLPLLVTTLYFTYSRGAWLSLGIGLVVALAAATRRVRLLAGLVAVGALDRARRLARLDLDAADDRQPVSRRGRARRAPARGRAARARGRLGAGGVARLAARRAVAIARSVDPARADPGRGRGRRRRRGRDGSLRRPEHDRGQGLARLHRQGCVGLDAERAALLLQRHRPRDPVEDRLAAGEGAPGRRHRRAHLRDLVEPRPAHRRPRARRAQPLPAGARRARRDRPARSWPARSPCRSAPAPWRAGGRSSPARSAPTPPTSRTGSSTGTGRSPA